jgi:microcompartment protein CcmK/EutM
MELARVVGSVVATVKEPRLTGAKLLLVGPVGVDGSPREAPPFVALDLVGAGEGEVVVVTRGTPAARATDVDGSPIDAAIVGIVDTIRSAGRTTFDKG